MPNSSTDMEADPIRERERKRVLRRNRRRLARQEYLEDFEDDRRESARRSLAAEGVERAAVDRAILQRFGAEPGWRVWHRNVRVPSTEVALLAGADLIGRRAIASDIEIHLGGSEILSPTHPFEPKHFLSERLGFQPRLQPRFKFKGPYHMEGVRHRLVLHYRRLDPHMTVQLECGRRLVVFFAGGCLDSNGHAEPGILRHLAGRAVFWKYAKPGDIRVLCVPRSSAFTKAVHAFRDAEGAKALDLHFATTERFTRDVAGFRSLAGPRQGEVT